MIANFQNGHDVLYHHAKFGEIELRAPPVDAKLWCLFVTIGLPARGGRRLNKYCVKIYRSILMRFIAFYHKGAFFQMHHTYFIFVTRWRHNFHEIVVNKLRKVQKSAERFVRTTTYR